MNKQYIIDVANTILQQIKAMTPVNVFFSWGVSKLTAQSFYLDDMLMAALIMQVNGFNFSGLVIITLDECVDYYRIYTAKDRSMQPELYMTDVDWEMLPNILDELIETGGKSTEEYEKQVDEFLQAKAI